MAVVGLNRGVALESCCPVRLLTPLPVSEFQLVWATLGAPAVVPNDTVVVLPKSKPTRTGWAAAGPAAHPAMTTTPTQPNRDARIVPLPGCRRPINRDSSDRVRKGRSPLPGGKRSARDWRGHG